MGGERLFDIDSLHRKYDRMRESAAAYGVEIAERPPQPKRAGSRPRNLLGRKRPWSWILEPTRGCNLRCGHCTVAAYPELMDAATREFMDERTWRATFETIAALTPCSRVEMANCGEPTLHPRLLDLLPIARELSPWSQIQVTTNGTRIVTGKLSYNDLFDAGANIILVDMYAPRSTHEKVVRAAQRRDPEILSYYYFDRPKDAPGAWNYTSPRLKLIVLTENPANWPRTKLGQGRLATLCDSLDWDRAAEFGLAPVASTGAPQKGCPQPFLYVSTHVSGAYEICCHDMAAESVPEIGMSMAEGPERFLDFWFGRVMQAMRRGLKACDRAGSKYCSRCSVTFNMRPWDMWDEDELQAYWNGSRWYWLPRRAER